MTSTKNGLKIVSIISLMSFRCIQPRIGCSLFLFHISNWSAQYCSINIDKLILLDNLHIHNGSTPILMEWPESAACAFNYMTVRYYGSIRGILVVIFAIPP